MPTVVSSVKPSEFCGTVPDSTGSICTKLKSLWSLANKVCTMATQFLNEDGSLSDDGVAFFAGTSVPVGAVMFWPMDLSPDGWIRLDGSIISRTTYSSLFGVYGIKYGAGDGSTTFQLPDLRRKFLLGSSGTNVAGSTGGAESVILEMENLPSEPPPLGTEVDNLLATKNTAVSDDTHPTFGAVVQTVVVGRDNSHSDHDENVLGDLGNDTPVDIMPPYFSGMWVAKI